MSAEIKDGHPLVPLERQLQCVEREIKKRQEVYPRLIEKGSLTRTKAADEIAAMIVPVDSGAWDARSMEHQNIHCTYQAMSI